MSVGSAVGFGVGSGVGFGVGFGVGSGVGLGVGSDVGLGVGSGVGLGVGSTIASVTRLCGGLFGKLFCKASDKAAAKSSFLLEVRNDVPVPPPPVPNCV